MRFQEIKNNIFYCGLNDSNRVIFDELIPLDNGTSYNSYLVKGSEKTAIIDTMYPPLIEEYVKNLDENGVAKQCTRSISLPISISYEVWYGLH